MEQNKLSIIDNDFNQIFELKNNEIREFVFIVLPNDNLSMNSTFYLNSNSNLTVKVIIINNSNYFTNINLNAVVNSNNNAAKLDVLVYGLNKSITNVVSNFEVNNKTYNNVVLQRIKGILLSNDTKIHGEPNLKINTLDVKAKHSLTIGALNNDEIFYLMSKGFNIIEVKQILIHSYLQSILSNLSDEDQNKCKSLVFERLSK